MMDDLEKAEWFGAFAKLCRTEVPHARKIGRYFFFALSSFGLGAICAVIVIAIGLSKDAANLASSVTVLAAFLALRDMSKAWDLALHASAAIAKAEGR